MSLQLEIVSEHREIVADDAVREFNDTGGTIGRSLQNDWILPDPDRYISSRHATIDFKGGAYYLADTSTNGVYMNGDCEPLGKGNPRRLFNGDKIRMGDFEIAVTLDEGESLVIPPEPPPSVAPDNIEQMVPEEPSRTGALLLDEEAITGDDEFQSTLFGSGPKSSAPPQIQEPEIDAYRTEAIGAAATNDPALTPGDLIDSFFDGLGINRAELHPATDLADVMQNAGEVLREFVAGSEKLLASRANLKNSFRLDQTTILPRHNNPLKLATNTTDAAKQLLVGKDGEYLGPRDAVREVCRDLLFHQDAIVDAMNSAFTEFADRFEPDELAEGFDLSMNSNRLAKLFNKSKYWTMYCDLYPIMTQKGDSRFPQMYAEEFVKAYERRIAERKRLGGMDDHLMDTVALNEDDIPTLAHVETITLRTPPTESQSDDDLDYVPADQAKG